MTATRNLNLMWKKSWNTPNLSPMPTLREIQAQLNGLGFGPLDEDGRLGPATLSATGKALTRLSNFITPPPAVLAGRAPPWLHVDHMDQD